MKVEYEFGDYKRRLNKLKSQFIQKSLKENTNEKVERWVVIWEEMKRETKKKERRFTKTQTVKKSNQKREITNNKERKEGDKEETGNKAKQTKQSLLIFLDLIQQPINQSIIWIFLFNSIDFCIFERFYLIELNWRDERSTTHEFCSTNQSTNQQMIEWKWENTQQISKRKKGWRKGKSNGWLNGKKKQRKKGD